MHQHSKPTVMQQMLLSIPEQCHEDWDKMTPTQQGRYCNACARQVVDFSMMSDAEVLRYFSTIKNEKVCGRAYPDQLERVIAMPKEPKKKLFWYWHYVTMLFLFFGKANGAKAQGTIRVVKSSPLLIKNNSIKKASSQKINKRVTLTNFVIKGSITDENGEPVSYASIKIEHTTEGASADDKGNFSIEMNQTNSTLIISALGYETKQIDINDFGEQKIILKKELKLLDNVVITSSKGLLLGRVGGVYMRVIKRNILKDSIKTVINNLTGAIKIYPNPVLKGNAFTLELKLKQNGTHLIQMVDAAGRVVIQKQIVATAKLYTEQMLTSGNWSSGVYYIRLFDSNNKFISTSSFVIQ